MLKYANTKQFKEQFENKGNLNQMKQEIEKVHNVLYKFSMKKLSTIINIPEL